MRRQSKVACYGNKLGQSVFIFYVHYVHASWCTASRVIVYGEYDVHYTTDLWSSQ